MACKIVYKTDSDGNLNVNEIDHVKAANGKRSLLFDAIDAVMPSSYDALAKYNIIHTKGFKSWYENGLVDSNNEPKPIIANNKILFSNGASTKILTNITPKKNLPINKRFKGKLVYAMSGTGKSFSSKFSEKVIDADELMYEMLGTTPLGFIRDWSKLSEKEKEDFNKRLLKKINELTTTGYTVLTPRKSFAKHADFIVLPDNVNRIKNDVLNQDRLNPYVISEEEVSKQIQELKDKNQLDKILTLNEKEYLSDILYDEEARKDVEDFIDVRLSQLLIEYLKPFGVKFGFIDKLSEKGITASYAIDTLNKMMLFDNGEITVDALTDATGHMVVELVGRHHAIIDSMKKKIKKGLWSSTEESSFEMDGKTYTTTKTTDHYKDLKKKLEKTDFYKNKDGSLNEDKVLNHAVGLLISDSIKNQSKIQDKSIIRQALDLINEIIQKLFGGNLDKARNSSYVFSQFNLKQLSDYISANILLNNNQFINTNIPQKYKRMTFEEMIEGSKELKSIHPKLKDRFLLVGSGAYRKQGTTYRSKDELLHDIDYLVPNEYANNWQQYVLEKFPSAIPAHGEWKDEDGSLTYAYYIPIGEGVRIISHKNEPRGDKGDFRAVDVKTNTPNGDDYIAVDFFVNPGKKEPLVQDEGLSRWDSSFLAKIAYGREKDLVDFRLFEIYDEKYRVPFSDISEDFSFYGDVVEDQSQYKLIEELNLDSIKLNNNIKEFADKYHKIDSDQTNIRESEKDVMEYVDSIINSDSITSFNIMKNEYYKDSNGELRSYDILNINDTVVARIQSKSKDDYDKGEDIYLENPTIDDILNVMKENGLDSDKYYANKIPSKLEIFFDNVSNKKISEFTHTYLTPGLFNIFNDLYNAKIKNTKYTKIKPSKEYYDRTFIKYLKGIIDKINPDYSESLIELFKSRDNFDIFKELFSNVVLQVDPETEVFNSLINSYGYSDLIFKDATTDIPFLFKNVRKIIDTTSSSELSAEILELLNKENITDDDRKKQLQKIHNKYVNNYYENEIRNYIRKLYSILGPSKANMLTKKTDFFTKFLLEKGSRLSLTDDNYYVITVIEGDRDNINKLLEENNLKTDINNISRKKNQWNYRDISNQTKEAVKNIIEKVLSEEFEVTNQDNLKKVLEEVSEIVKDEEITIDERARINDLMTNKNPISTIIKLQPIHNTTSTTRSLKSLLDGLSNRFNIPYSFTNNPNGKWAGRYKPDGTIEFNEAYLHQYPDTPFHEFFHPFLDVIEKQNKKLFANLKNEIDSILSSNDSPEMKMRLKRITNSKKGGKYVDENGNLTEIGYKEAITELVGAMALQMHNTEWRRRIKAVNPKWEPSPWESKTGPRISEKRMEKNKSLFQKLMDYVRTIIRKVFRSPNTEVTIDQKTGAPMNKEGFVSPQDMPVIPSELNPNMTLSDLGYLMGVDTARPVRLDLEASLDQPIQEKAIEDTFQIDLTQYNNNDYSEEQRKILNKYNENVEDLIPGKIDVNISEIKDPKKRRLLGLRGDSYQSYRKRPGKNGREFVENRVSMAQDLKFLSRSRKTAEEIRAQEDAPGSELGRKYGTLLHVINEDVLHELIDNDVTVDLTMDKYEWAEQHLKNFRNTALYKTFVEEIKKDNTPFEYTKWPNGNIKNNGIQDYEELIKSMSRLYYQVYEQQEIVNKELSEKAGKPIKHKPVFMLERPLYDEAADEAGTTDMMVLFSDGTALIYDHKFIKFPMVKTTFEDVKKKGLTLDYVYEMRAKQGLSTNRKNDNNWFYSIDPDYKRKLYNWKQDAYDMQLSRYSEMLTKLYGVSRIRQARIIPTAVNYTTVELLDEDGKTLTTPSGKPRKGLDPNRSRVKYLMTGERMDKLLNQIPSSAETTGDAHLDKFITDLERTREKIRNVLNKKGWQDNPILVDRYNNLMDTIISIKTERNIDSILVAIQKLVKDVENRLEEPRYLEDGAENPKYINLEDVNELKKEISLYSGFSKATDKMIDDLKKDEAALDAFETAVGAAFYKLDEIERKINNKVIELLSDLNDKHRLMSEEKFLSYSQQKDISQVDRWMAHLSNIRHPLVGMFKQLLDRVNYNRFEQERELQEEIRLVNEELRSWAKANGMNIYQAYNKMLNDQKNLVAKYSSKYYKMLNNARENISDENTEWFRKNFHRNEFQEKSFQEWKKKKRKEFESYYTDKTELEEKWESWLNENDITHNDGKNNAWYRSNVRFTPINEDQYYSDEYLYIMNNKPLLDFYNFYREKNALFNSQVDFSIKNNFVPEIHKKMIDTLLQDGIATTAMGLNVFRAIKENWKYRESDDMINISEEDKQVPVMFMDSINPKNKSIDLAQSMFLFGSYVNQYQGLKELEHVAMAIKELIANTDVVETHLGRKQKMKGTQNFKTISKDNKQILAFFDDVVNYYVYGEKMSSGKVKDKELSPQATKIVSKMIELNSKKNIAFNFLSAAGGHLGAMAQLQSIAKKGNYFTLDQLFKSRNLMGKFNKEITFAMEYFRPNQDEMKYEIAEELNKNMLHNKWTRGKEFWLQRKSDDLIEHSIMGAMLQNYGINPVTGKAEPIPNLKEMFKDHPEYKNVEWKSLFESINMDTDKPYIINQHTGEKINERVFISFRNKVRGVSSKVKGNMSQEDIAAYKTTLIGKTMMQFRGWIPAMLRHRLKNQQYDVNMEDFEVGTWIAAFNMIKAGGLKAGGMFMSEVLPFIRHRYDFAYNSKVIDERFALWKDQNPAEFVEFMKSYDLDPNNDEDVAKAEELMKKKLAKEYIAGLKSLAKEVQMYLALYSVMLLVMYGSADDERKTNPLIKGAINLAERAMLEVGFFIPGLDWATTGNFEMQKMVSRSPIPAMDIINSGLGLFSNTAGEVQDVFAGISPFEDKQFKWMDMPDEAWGNPFVMETEKDKKPVLYYTRDFLPGVKGLTKSIGMFNTTEQPDTWWDWLTQDDSKVYK